MNLEQAKNFEILSLHNRMFRSMHILKDELTAGEGSSEKSGPTRHLQ